MTSTNQPTIKQVLFSLFVLLSCFFPAAFAYAVTSSLPAATLKTVTITDSASKNAPPNAVIKYTEKGNTLNFDASGSNDSDGTIADYKWDFGDGTTGTGVTISHAYSGYKNFPVTLSVVDNKGGVGLVQTQINLGYHNFHLSVLMRSQDDDSIGVMFGFVDSNNYYRFEWNKQRGFRRVVKDDNGKFSLIAGDHVPYVIGQNYLFEIVTNGANVKISIDHNVIFSFSENNFPTGAIALYSWGNQGAVYDNLQISDNATGAILYENSFEPGSSLNNWTIVDEGDKQGPSNWSITKTGVLYQSSNIYSGDANSSAVLPRLSTYIIVP